MKYRLGWLIAFSALSLLGNYFSLAVGFNIDFLFGSVFGLIAIVLLGPFWGIPAFLAGAAYTFILWNHPYAILIFGCEALWFSLVRNRKPTLPIIRIDLSYWAILGTPLVFLFYYGVMNLGLPSSVFIAMKQSLNGVSNAALASVLLHYLPFWKHLRLPARPVRSHAQILFESMAFLLLIPCIGGLIYMNQKDIRISEEALAVKVKQVGQEADWLLSQWLDQHLRATEYLAEKGREAGFTRTPALQREVSSIHRLYPDFHNVFVADGTSATLAFDPMVNERGESTIGLLFSDRDWFRSLKETQKQVISDVFMGRGGVFQPIFSISTPVILDGRLIGFGLGAVNLERMGILIRELAESSRTTITVLDRHSQIIVSTNQARKVLAPFRLVPTPETKEIIRGVFLYLPKSEKNISVMRIWQEALFFSRTPIEATGWTILAEGPLAPLQQSIYDRTTFNMGAIFLLLFATGGVSFWMSRHLARPARDLARISMDIPQKIEAGEEIDWPCPDSQEMDSLVHNFKKTSETLRDKINVLKNHGHVLESAVAERTAELQTSNDKFRIVFENEIYAICLFDLETLRFLDANRAYERVYGYARSELLSGMTIHEITVEHEASDQSTGEAIRSGTIFIPLRYHKRKNGEVFPVEIVGGPYEWNGKKVMFALAHDISARVKAEKAWHDSEARWQFALEGSGDGLWDWNAVSNQVFFSRRWKEMLGYSESEIGNSLSEWESRVHPDDKGKCYEDLGRHFRGETEVYVNEHRLLCRDGSFKWILDRGRVIEWAADGKPLRVIGTHADITRRKEMELALKTLADSRKVLLQEVNHRVKNNLALIVGMIHLEVSKLKDSPRRKMIGELESRVKTLSRVHSMLSQSEWRAIRISDLCLQIVSDTLPREKNPGIAIAPSDAAVESSQAHNLALVINELATNTSKYGHTTDSLAVAVEISLCEGELEIRYGDNGPGYPQAVLDGNEELWGTGLRLVKGIVEQSLYGSVTFSNDGGAVTRIRMHSMPHQESAHE